MPGPSKAIAPANPDAPEVANPFHRPLPPGVRETDPEAWAQRHRESEEQYLYLKRMVVGFARFHRYCPLKACRRAGECRSPTVECHDANVKELRKEVYPAMRVVVRAALRAKGLMP